MRRLVFCLAVMIVVSSTVVPAYAFEWPPENYDMSYTVITEDTASLALSGIKSSLGSITNISIKIMGIVVSVSLIGSLFDILVLEKLRMREAVRKKEWGRAVDKLDRALNYDSIVIDRLEQNSLRCAVNRLDRRLNTADIVQDRVEQLEINHMAKWRFMQRNLDGLVEERILQMEINNEARRRFGVRNSRKRLPKPDINQQMYESEQAYLLEE